MSLVFGDSVFLEMDSLLIFRDPESIASPAGGFQEAAKQLPKPLKARIAWTPDLGGVSPMDPEVADTCHEAVKWLQSQGAQLTTACPDLTDSENIFQVITFFLRTGMSVSLCIWKV